MEDQLLTIRNLRTHFFTDDGVVPAVDGIDLDLKRGETLGIVGESGCGKSVTSLSVMGLIPQPPGKIVSGSIRFAGQELLGKSDEEMRRLRGKELAMIFQEPMTSLNPVYTIGDQIMEAFRYHVAMGKAEARRQAIELLRRVGIPSPEQRVADFPHQLSGGMRQRVMIGMALACNPKLLIADEPTTALDVTIQAQILDLMRNLRRDLGTSILLITHDMGVIAEMADEVMVMYAGKVVERAEAKALFEQPQHPYTIGLLDSIPKLDQKVERLSAIEGSVPGPRELPHGCRFHTRCKDCREICIAEEPPLRPVRSTSHQVACWKQFGYQKSEQ